MTTGQVKVRVMPSTFWISRHDELAEVVERADSALHDHVVGTGDVVGVDHAGDAPRRLGDLLGPPDLGLDQHVRGDAMSASVLVVRRRRERPSSPYGNSP